MTGKEVAEELGEPYRHGYGYVRIRCYNSSFHKHDDRDPSLVIYDGNRGFYCYGCGANGSHEWLFKQFGQDRKISYGSERSEKIYTKYNFDNVKVGHLRGEYLEQLQAKGFSKEKLARYNWGIYLNNIPNVYGNGVLIPYYWQGEIVGARLRLLDGPIRFKSLPGAESFPYLFDNIKNDFVFVCEGESDTITLDMLGFKSIGIPGATNTTSIRKLVNAASLYGTTLCVVPDNDNAGRDFYERVKRLGDEYNVDVRMLQVPVGKDVNEWFNLVGEERVNQYLKEHKYEQNGSVPKDSTRGGQTDFRLV